MLTLLNCTAPIETIINPENVSDRIAMLSTHENPQEWILKNYHIFDVFQITIIVIALSVYGYVTFIVLDDAFDKNILYSWFKEQTEAGKIL